MSTFPVHPAADLFPRMSADDLAALADDIKENGLQRPILLAAGVLLDGRDRLAACEMAGVEPRYSEFVGKSQVSAIVSANIKRKHFTAGQLASVAADLVPLYSAEGRAAKSAGGGDKRSEKARSDGSKTPPSDRRDPAARSTAKAAKATGASPHATEQIASVKKKAPEVAAVVKAGKGTVADAQRVAKLPDVARAEVVERVNSGEVATLKEALAAQPKTTERLDALGRVLPDEIADEYERAAGLLGKASNLATQLVGALSAVNEARAWDRANRLRDQIRLAGLEIRQASPATACVYCKLLPDRLADCTHCKGRGISSASQFEYAIGPLKIGGADAVVFSLEPWADGEVRLVRVADVLAGRAR